ncbi:hypothetical protein AURDEDRAFT_124894 [Auricularia subglabra TFB-10046 SS5]|nr:hypothetical protein AURDEDRAFT_124894 [Auricularia subglabra TFB-10046 SS5]
MSAAVAVGKPDGMAVSVDSTVVQGVAPSTLTLSFGPTPSVSEEKNFISRLPAELLLGICQLLHLTDRLAVADTCRSWKRTAVASPCSWSKIYYCHAPPKDILCMCNEVSDLEPGHDWNHHYYPGQTDGLVKRGGSNIEQIRRVLPWSGQRRLRISLQVLVPLALAESRIRALAQLLQPHTDRIETIHIVSCINTFPALLIDTFDGLPALRRLTTAYTTNQPSEETPFTSKADVFPALREIVFDTSFTTWPTFSGFALPSLQKVSLFVKHVRQIASVLSTCPRLRTLCVTLLPGGSRSQVAFDSPYVQTIASFAGRLKHVRVEGVLESDERWVRAAFDDGALPTLDLAYDEYAFPDSGWRIFSQLSHNITLEVTHRDEMLTIRATDARGTSRAIVLDMERYKPDVLEALLTTIFRQLWKSKCLAIASVKHLTLDISVLLEFIKSFPRNNNRVEQIDLISTHPSHSSALSRKHRRTDPSRFFPEIQTVRFVRVDGSIPPLEEKTVGFVESCLQLETDYYELEFREAQRLVVELGAWVDFE